MFISYFDVHKITHISYLFPPLLSLPNYDDYRFLLGRANRAFLERRKAGIGIYKDTGKRDPELEIERLEHDQSSKSKKFERIHRDFPLQSLPGQCAYVLRSFSGLQIFPDANHRSAFYFLRVILWKRGITLEASPPDAADLVRALKERGGRYFTGGLRQDRLNERDASYWYIRTWFAARLRWKSLRQPIRFYVLQKDEPLEAWDWSHYHQVVDGVNLPSGTDAPTLK